jgi:DUF971 family protein
LQITPDQLMTEASRMALEIRFKDTALAELEAENERMRSQLAEHEKRDSEPAPDGAAPGRCC